MNWLHTIRSAAFGITLVSLLIACSSKPTKTGGQSGSAGSTIAGDTVPAYGEEFTGVAFGQPEWDKRLENNPFVKEWLDYFQGRGRKYMELYLARSSRYLDLMKGILKNSGMPEELVFVPMIESGYSFSAKSNANAVGYWQFIRATGKRYGLRINNVVDERRDPILSTQAASQYLKGLYSLFGSWELALAAYNVGENRVQRVLMNNYTRDYWEMARRRLLPAETLNYVPKFVAAALIARNPDKYGFTDIKYYEPFKFDEITLNKAVNLRRMAAQLNVPYQEFKMYNPAFKGDHAPLGPDRKVVIRVPAGSSQDTAKTAIEQSVVTTEKPTVVYDNPNEKDYVYYRVRRGDNLHRIAQRYGVRQQDILKLNNFESGNIIRSGVKIKIPLEANERKESSVSPADPSTSMQRSPARRLQKDGGREIEKLTAKTKEIPGATAISGGSTKSWHTVRRGETLTGIAHSYGVSLDRIISANRLDGDKGRLLAGQRIRIPIN